MMIVFCDLGRLIDQVAWFRMLMLTLGVTRVGEEVVLAAAVCAILPIAASA